LDSAGTSTRKFAPTSSVLGVAEHLGERVVDVGVAVIEHHVDADLAVLDQRAITQFGALQRPLAKRRAVTSWAEPSMYSTSPRGSRTI
jgi:hypothetical protein